MARRYSAISGQSCTYQVLPSHGGLSSVQPQETLSGSTLIDHLIIVNERDLRLLLREYVAHYNHVQAHQALELCAPDHRRPRSPPRSEGQVVARPILGGLHHEYERLAA